MHKLAQNDRGRYVLFLKVLYVTYNLMNFLNRGTATEEASTPCVRCNNRD